MSLGQNLKVLSWQLAGYHILKIKACLVPSFQILLTEEFVEKMLEDLEDLTSPEEVRLLGCLTEAPMCVCEVWGRTGRRAPCSEESESPSTDSSEPHCLGSSASGKSQLPSPCCSLAGSEQKAHACCQRTFQQGVLVGRWAEGLLHLPQATQELLSSSLPWAQQPQARQGSASLWSTALKPIIPFVFSSLLLASPFAGTYLILESPFPSPSPLQKLHPSGI